MKKLLFLLLTFFSIAAYAQQPLLLSKNVSDLNEDIFNQLIAKGYLTKTERILFGSYIIAEDRKDPKIERLTIGEMLSRYRAFLKEGDSKTAQKNNYGPDSVFMRTPTNQRYFIGMGKLSLEKLVTKYSANLPASYTGEENLVVTKDRASLQKLGEIIASAPKRMLIGSVLMIRRERNELFNHKTGEIFEIARRIASSAEFQPFQQQIK